MSNKSLKSQPEPNATQAVNLKSRYENFEKFLSDLSASFVRVAVEEIDHEIQRWLQRIVLAMDLDRGTLAQFDADGSMCVTHQWAREGVTAPDIGSVVRDAFPWIASKLLSGESVIISRIDEFPPEAVEERSYAKLNGGARTIAMPLRIGKKIVGAASFGATFSESRWSRKDVKRLRLVAEIFGNALERKHAFAEHRRLEEDLRKMEGVALVGELAAILAHELKQPLTAILNNAETAHKLTTKENLNRTQITHALADIIRDDARADEIIRNVRALFQRDSTRKSSVDLKALLVDVERIANMSARTKGIRLSVDVPESLPSVSGNRTQLTQATLHLLFNAFDSVCAADTAREVSLSAMKMETGRVRVSIRDSGKGIDPKIMTRLFEPFFTTKATGMGVGLAIVRSIIENHRGKIWAKQNPGLGATLEFELPIV